MNEFKNQTDQRERREILKDTYLSRAQSDADLGGGRFKKVTETRVIGVPQYPQQPASSPWHHDPVPATQPLGFAVDEMVPTGTSAEIEKSIRENSDTPSSSIAPSPQSNQGDGLSTFSSEDDE